MSISESKQGSGVFSQLLRNRLNALYLCSSLFLISGVVLSGLQLGFVALSARATGKVTAIKALKDDEASIDFVFRDASGAEHAISKRVTLAAGPYQLGGDLHIRYLPSSPTFTQIDSFVSLWAFPLGFTGMGTLGLAVPWLLRRHTKPALAVQSSTTRGM